MAKAKLTPDQRKDAVRRYQEGETMQEIADLYGVTRQAIGRITAKSSVSGDDGGAKVKLQKNKDAAANRKDSKYQGKYGCTYSEYLDFIKNNGMLPVYHFRNQKSNAKWRGIGWHFTLHDWWSVWHESGRWSERGRGAERFCMSRIDDIGPYMKGNVKVATNRENIQEVRFREAEERKRESSYVL